MAEEKFIMLNLEDIKSKEIAQVISSDTARKILNLLSDKAYSETDIAKEMNLPLSTAHYNIQALLKANIIEEKDFLWSEKGKKIKIYKLANKLIIISPKTQSSDFLDKLKGILPVAIFGSLISLALLAYQSLNSGSMMASKTSEAAFDYSETMVESTAASAPEAARILSSTADINIAFWFFLGVIITVGSYILIALARRKK